MARSIHSKKKIQLDMAYIRRRLCDAKHWIDQDDWLNAQAVFQEIAGIASDLETLAWENHIEIKDARYMDPSQVEAIMEERFGK